MTTNDLRKNERLRESVQQIRGQDIVPVLQNALNYGEPWNALYQAAIEEINELRCTVIKLAKN